jgi:amino acid transporter
VSFLGPRGEGVARAVMVLSMLAGLNAYPLMASRVVHAMARDGLFFEAAAAVNRGGTPPVSPRADRVSRGGS